MAERPGRKLFVNVPVRDLKKSMDFFAALGFTYNPKASYTRGASMIRAAIIGGVLDGSRAAQ
jgi:uncharacterized protein